MFDEPMANSSMFALPRNTAPSRSRLALTVLSYGGMNGSRMRLPAVVRTPSVQNRSLIASGMPVSGANSPRASAASAASACASARSPVTVMIGVQPRIQRVDRREMRLGQLARGELSRSPRAPRRW